MTKVLVTGANGFIGKNLCAHLKRDESIELLCLNRGNTDNELRNKVEQADFIFHLAGVNRPKEVSEFDKGNRGLTEKIVDILRNASKQTPVLLTSSTQAELDNPYGKSKLAAENIIFDLSKNGGGRVYIYRLPGVFGKWCKPNYNSVIATFCYNICHNIDVTINESAPPIRLVYIDDVIKVFLDCLANEVKPTKDSYYTVGKEFSITLPELERKLQSFRDSRHSLLMPSFESEFDRNLYATYTSYFDEDDIGYELEKRTDDRGWLAEFIKSQQFGQIYISQTNPGFTRGIHWHDTKIEKFLVIGGVAEIKMRDLYSDNASTLKVSGDKLEVMEMPAGRVHSIKNIGDDKMYLLIWSQQVFDPEKPDTYWEDV